MVRSVGRGLTIGAVTLGTGVLAALGGCSAGVSEPSPSPTVSQPTREVRRPVLSTAAQQVPAEAEVKPEVSWDTERDATYARFLQRNSGGMIRKAAVGIENRGTLRVEISRAVEPEDTLPLTKSLVAGARKDFPDSPFTLSVYDPDDKPILKARVRPGEGVRYQIAHGGETGSPSRPNTTPPPSRSDDPLARGGVTERDQKFAAWAEEHGKPLLRYVEADLEKHGRLWFGITRAVKPEEVRPLAKSLLEGASREFPRRELAATVFDPDGERIGKAHLERGGDVRWEK